MEEGKRLKKNHQRLSVCGSSPSSGQGKLIIPKVQNVVVAEDPIGDQGNNHTRVHSQINKEMKPKKPLLRSHPEREWTGIQPSAWAMNTIDLQATANNITRLAQMTANNLMRVTQMKSLESGLTHKEHVEVSNSNSSTRKAPIEESSLLKIDESNDGKATSMKKRRLMMDLETSVKDAVIVGTTTKTSDHKFKVTSVPSSPNKTKAQQLPTSATFVTKPSHQVGLLESTRGVTGPLRPKLHLPESNKQVKPVYRLVDFKVTIAERPITTKQNQGPAATYKCNVCDKTFPSRRALGGHKKCHSTTPAQAPPT